MPTVKSQAELQQQIIDVMVDNVSEDVLVGAVRTMMQDQMLSVDGRTNTVQNTSASPITHVVTDVLLTCDTTLNDILINLKAAPLWAGKTVNIKKTAGKNKVTISPNGAELIDGELAFSFFNRNEAISIQSDGAAVSIVSVNKPQDANVTTGTIITPVVTLNADPTKFDITAGTIAIEDWSNPAEMRLKLLKYPGVTGQLPPNATTNIFTTLTLIESATEGIAELKMTSQGVFSPQTRREEVALPAVLHQLGDGVIQSFTEDFQIAYGWDQAANDMNHCRGACNTGNAISANGANLTFDKAVGTTGMQFFNAASAPWLNPSVITNDAVVQQEFVYQAQEPAGPFVGVGRNTLDPDNYDNNGVITALANNKWTIQRVYLFGQSDTMTILYGPVVYSSQGAAEVAIETEDFSSPDNIVDGVWICSFVLKKGTTDLSDTGNNTIINRVSKD